MMRFALPFIAALLVVGCASTNPDVPDTQDDVPVPLGFKRTGDDEKTKSHYEKHEKFRNYRVTYSGKSLPADVAAFYAREMKTNGWTLENNTPGPSGREVTMTFLKELERCTVTTQQLDEERSSVVVDIRYK